MSKEFLLFLAPYSLFILLFYSSLGILILTLGAQLVPRFFIKYKNSFSVSHKYNTLFAIADKVLYSKKERGKERGVARFFSFLFFFSIIFIFSLLAFQSYQQYQSWSQNEVSRYLLPPHQPINYFIFYIFARFFAPYLISLAAAFLFLFLAKIFNKKYNERFFYSEELYLGALSLFIVSHPGWLFYAIFIIVVYLLIHLYSLFIIHYSSQRLSLYYLWIPVAILVIMIQKWLQILPWWYLLKI